MGFIGANGAGKTTTLKFILNIVHPDSGLNPVARDRLLDIFRELVQGGEISILFSTHITTDLEKCADYSTYSISIKSFEKVDI